ncbi:MAG: protein kinase, partial [Myxococcota bacterium]
MVTPTFPPDAPSLSEGRYVLVSRLGEGRIGAVYRAYDRKDRVARAIKVLLEPSARDAAVRARFAQTNRRLLGMRDPHLIRILDVGDANGLPFVVMELATGGTLGAWRMRHGPMPPQLACGAVLEIARGLSSLHLVGVSHGGVAAHNGLVTVDGVRKLSDPSVIDDATDPLADVVALGALIEALAGPIEELPPGLASIAAECGIEALSTADGVAEALEQALMVLPPEPPGTPDVVLDLSNEEWPLSAKLFPELEAMMPPSRSAIAAALDAAQTELQEPPTFADPGDADDQPSWVDRAARSRPPPVPEGELVIGLDSPQRSPRRSARPAGRADTDPTADPGAPPAESSATPATVPHRTATAPVQPPRSVPTSRLVSRGPGEPVATPLGANDTFDLAPGLGATPE